MQCARSGYRDLGKQRGPVLDEIEIIDVYRMRPAQPAVDERHRLCATPAAALRTVSSTFGVRASDGVDAHISQLLIKEAVIRPAAVFAVRSETQPKLLLQRDRLGNRGVLGRCQIIL